MSVHSTREDSDECWCHATPPLCSIKRSEPFVPNLFAVANQANATSRRVMRKRHNFETAGATARVPIRSKCARDRSSTCPAALDLLARNPVCTTTTPPPPRCVMKLLAARRRHIQPLSVTSTFALRHCDRMRSGSISDKDEFKLRCCPNAPTGATRLPCRCMPRVVHGRILFKIDTLTPCCPDQVAGFALTRTGERRCSRVLSSPLSGRYAQFKG